MATRAQKIRVGLFFLTGIVGTVILIVLIFGRGYLRGSDTYYVAYEGVSVRGLEQGSPVEYLGVRVGTVKEIGLDPENPARIVVTLHVEKNTPIRADAVADIAHMGITGLKAILIRGGTRDARVLESGEFIGPGSTSITEEITGKAEVLAEKFEIVLNNLTALTSEDNQEKIVRLADSAGKAFAQVDSILGENREGIRSALANLQRASARFDTVSVLLYDSAGEINAFVSGDTLGEILSATRGIVRDLSQADLAKLLVELGGLAKRVNRLLTQIDRDVDRGSVELLTTVERLNATIDNLHQASQLIVDDPSVLIRGSRVTGNPDERLED